MATSTPFTHLRASTAGFHPGRPGGTRRPSSPAHLAPPGSASRSRGSARRLRRRLPRRTRSRRPTSSRRASSSPCARRSAWSRRRRARGAAGTWTSAAWRAGGRRGRRQGHAKGRGRPRCSRRVPRPPRRYEWRAGGPGTRRRVGRSSCRGPRQAAASLRQRRRRSPARARAASGTGGSR